MRKQLINDYWLYFHIFSILNCWSFEFNQLLGNNNDCTRIIYQFMTMQNPFLQKITPLTSKYTKSSFFRQYKSKPNKSIESSFNPHSKQHHSLLSIYAEKLSEKKKSLNQQRTQETKQEPHREWVPLNCRDNHLLLYTIQNKNNKNKRVQSTINSVNTYSEELRMTLLNQYKTRKQKELLREKQKFQRKKMQKEAVEKLENPQITNNSNLMLTKYSNRAIAFKTINLLYKAIIDNSFHKRKKQQFQVHANRFPIINRRQPSKRRQKLKQAQQQQDTRLQNRITFLNLNLSNKQVNSTVIKNKPVILKDNVDIFPWKSDDEEVDEN